jgi:hypothetical protein
VLAQEPTQKSRSGSWRAEDESFPIHDKKLLSAVRDDQPSWVHNTSSTAGLGHGVVGLWFRNDRDERPNAAPRTPVSCQYHLHPGRWRSKGRHDVFYHNLSQHPEIRTSSIKEPDFDVYHAQVGEFCHRTWFPSVGAGQMYGDCSSASLHLPFVAPRVRTFDPDARLTCVLLDPVERAYSG